MNPALMDMIMRLRGQGISDNSVLQGCERAPREVFLPSATRADAYAERSVPIACGQSLPAPFALAVMAQCLNVRPEHKVLVVGSGTGCLVALLSHCGKRVFGVERYARLVEQSETALASLEIHTVSVRHGDGMRGWAGQAPYDRIIVTAEIKALSKSLTEQLAPDGTVVCVMDGQLMRGVKTSGDLAWTPVIPLSLPPIERGKSHAL